MIDMIYIYIYIYIYICIYIYIYIYILLELIDESTPTTTENAVYGGGYFHINWRL